MNITFLLCLWPILGVIAFAITHRNHIQRWNYHNWHFDGWKEDLQNMPTLLEHFHTPWVRGGMYFMTLCVMILLGPIVFHKTIDELLAEYSPKLKALLATGLWIGILAVLLCSCKDGQALPKYTGQTEHTIITINPNTARIIMAPKDSRKQAKFFSTDSIYVFPSEAFVIALKGGKPICTVFTRQDSAVWDKK